MLAFSATVKADVVSYFNFDDGNYVNSQLTPTVNGTPTSITGKYDQALDYAVGDRWVFTGDQLVNFLSSIDKTCTVSFWAKSNSDTFSTGQYKQAFWLSSSAAIDANLAANSQNYRNMFTHYAYDNGNHLYFDSGITGYDRIDTNTTTATYPTDEWVHWAYVKDANAGTMRVYRNGVELVSGGNKKRSIEGIVAMTIANDLSVQMDDFVVDNRALPSGEILQLATSQTALVSDVMNRSLNNASMEISPGGIGEVGTMRFIQQENVAYGRGDYASQINIAGGAGADRAVDGNTNTTWGGGSMIHTNGGAVGDWWQVQFSDTAVPVDKVTIWNRTEGNGCDQRLGNFTLNFYTEDPSANADAAPVYSYHYSGIFPGGQGSIDIPDTFNANWVRITNGIAQPLNISEVQIYTPTDNGGFSAASNNGAMIDGKNYQTYNLTLSDNSVLTMDVDGANMDKLSVSGALVQGGTVKFNFIDASTVTAADITNMISANSATGGFKEIIITGDDAATFDKKNIVIRSVAPNKLFAEERVHWLANPEDKNFANVNNWSSDPTNQEVAVGLYGDEAAGMTLNTSMSLGYVHFAQSQTVGEASLTLNNGANLSVTGMSLGENDEASMTVNSGATFTDTGNLIVGHGDYATGTLNVDGGTVTVNKLRVGDFQTAKGYVNITNGEVTVNTESEIGNKGVGEITVSNDSKLTFNSTVRIANNGGGPSFINLEDDAEMSVTHLFVGQRGANLGSMTLSGNSKLTVKDHLEIGTDSGSNGSGTMTLKDNAQVKVTNTGTNRTRIGYNAGTSTLNVSDNATFTVDGYSFLVADSATGIINQTGGTINISTNNPTYTGDQAGGKAFFNISGGQFNVNNQFISGTRGMSTINLSGNGEFNANQLFTGAPGYALNSYSYVNQTGGTFNAKAGIVYGLNANQGSGVYNLEGGTLNATTITKKDGYNNLNAQFYMSGGVANIDTLAIPAHVSGGTLNAGTIDTTLSYKDTFAQSGGVLTIGGTDTIGTTTITGSYLAATQLDAANVALTGTAFKESGYQGDTFPANLGNDGDYGNFTHTAEDGTNHIPYWGVSYGEDVNFGKVVVFNRNFTGDPNNRLTDGVGFYIDVLDGADNVLWQSQTYKGGGTDSGFVVDVPYDVQGQKIRVVRGGETTAPLNLAEVEVYAYSPVIDTSNLPTMKFEIQSADSYDQLVLQGNSFDISAGAALDVTALDAQALEGLTGTTLFQIIALPDNVDINGEFAEINLPDLEEGYMWDLTRLYSDGVLGLVGPAVEGVPEPSTWALLLLGAAGLLYWRKRK